MEGESLMDLIYSDMQIVDQDMDGQGDEVENAAGVEVDGQGDEADNPTDIVDVHVDGVGDMDPDFVVLEEKPEEDVKPEAIVLSAPSNVDVIEDVELKATTTDESKEECEQPEANNVVDLIPTDDIVTTDEFTTVDDDLNSDVNNPSTPTTESPVEKTEKLNEEKTSEVNSQETSQVTSSLELDVSDVLHLEDTQSDLDSDLQTLQKGEDQDQSSEDKSAPVTEVTSGQEAEANNSEESEEKKKDEKKTQEGTTSLSKADEGKPNKESKEKDDGSKATKSEDRSSSDKQTSSTNSEGSTGCNLWVSGLQTSTKAADLKTLFGKHGKVVVTKVLASSKTPGTKCYGFITMSSSEEASKCVQHLNGTKLEDKYVIQVTKKEPKSSGKPGNKQESTQPSKGSEKGSADKKPADAKKDSKTPDDKKDKKKITERRSYRSHSNKESGGRRDSDRRSDSRHGRPGSFRGNRNSRRFRQRDRRPSRYTQGRNKTDSRSTSHRRDVKDNKHDSKDDKTSNKDKRHESKERKSVSSSQPATASADKVADNKNDVQSKDVVQDSDKSSKKETVKSAKEIIPFEKMKEEKMKEWERLKKRKQWLEKRKRIEIESEKRRQKDIHIKQRIEAIKIAEEREFLKKEREMLERERLEAQRRERIQLERMEHERLQREREEKIRLEHLRMEEERERRALKRMFDRAVEDEWMDSKRQMMSNSYPRERYSDVEMRGNRYDDSRMERNMFERRVERYDKRDPHRPEPVREVNLRDDRRDDRFDRFPDRAVQNRGRENLGADRREVVRDRYHYNDRGSQNNARNHHSSERTPQNNDRGLHNNARTSHNAGRVDDRGRQQRDPPRGGDRSSNHFVRKPDVRGNAHQSGNHWSGNVSTQQTSSLTSAMVTGVPQNVYMASVPQHSGVIVAGTGMVAGQGLQMIRRY